MKFEDLIQNLRDQGYRLTPQRRLTLEVLYQNNYHLSADEIAQKIVTRYPNMAIDQATIYRTLKWLRDVGIVGESNVGQQNMVYVLLQQHKHHHLVCANCEALIDADPAIFDAVREELQTRYGFTARMEHLSIFGLCAACSQTPSSTLDNDPDASS